MGCSALEEITKSYESYEITFPATGFSSLDPFLLNTYFQYLLIDAKPVLTVLDILLKAHKFACANGAQRACHRGHSELSGLQHCLSWPCSDPHVSQVTTLTQPNNVTAGSETDVKN